MSIMLRAMLLVALATAPASAQQLQQMPNYKTSAGNITSAMGSVDLNPDGTTVPAKRAEVFALVSANTPSAAATLYGGTYVFNQTCTGYGTLTLRYRAADGSTMINLVSKSVADNAGGTMLQFGAGQVVDTTVSGTTACNATLSRIQQ